MLGGVVHTHGTTLYCTYTVVDNLNTRVLLIIESSIEAVAEHQHIAPLAFEILEIVQLEILGMGCCHRQQSDHHK